MKGQLAGRCPKKQERTETRLGRLTYIIFLTFFQERRNYKKLTKIKFDMTGLLVAKMRYHGSEAHTLTL